jgi:pimeloyl-ACP methyl ester carboxylesterase
MGWFRADERALMRVWWLPQRATAHAGELRSVGGPGRLCGPWEISRTQYAGRDRLIDIEDQSARLHADIPQSTFHRVPGAGHMVHQTATNAVMSAIDEAVGTKLRKAAKIAEAA